MFSSFIRNTNLQGVCRTLKALKKEVYFRIYHLYWLKLTNMYFCLKNLRIAQILRLYTLKCNRIKNLEIAKNNPDTLMNHDLVPSTFFYYSKMYCIIGTRQIATRENFYTIILKWCRCSYRILHLIITQFFT